MKIILADDDQISRKIISGFLARFGYKVEVVNDGAEAWNLLQAPNSPQLAIVDWMMPRMSGLEVAAKVRTLNKKERIYIILLSSRNSKLDIVKGLEAGADDYLVKPCDLAELQARLRVAERTLIHDQQLRKTISELENLARRHNLLGTIASQRQAAVPETTEAAPAVAPTPQSTPAAPSKPAAAQQPKAPASTPEPKPNSVPDIEAKLKDALAASFKEVGLGTGKLEEASDFVTGPEFSVILPFYFPGSQQWVDVRFEFDRRGAHGACRSLLKRGANSPQELQDVLVELIHLLSGTRSMGELKAGGGLLSFTAAPIGTPGSPVELHRQGSARYLIRVGEISTLVTEFATEAAIHSKTTDTLEPGEIVVDQVANPKSPEVSLASPGDVLTRNRITQIREENANGKIRIVRVPDSSRAYLPISF